MISVNDKILKEEFNIENIAIQIWENEFFRDQGHADTISLETIIENWNEEEINTEPIRSNPFGYTKSIMEDVYKDHLKKEGGSMELVITDNKGSWITSLYHISEDTDHELKSVDQNSLMIKNVKKYKENK